MTTRKAAIAARHEETTLEAEKERYIMFTEAETNFLTKLVRDHIVANMGGVYDRSVCLGALVKLGQSAFGVEFTGEKRTDERLIIRRAVVPGEV